MHSKNNLNTSTGILAIIGSLTVVICFILLGKTFGYPEIIRQSPEVILNRLYEQRHIVPYLYYIGVGLGGLSIIIISILLRLIFRSEEEKVWAELGSTFGILSGLLLYAGIVRYTFLFPYLAEQRVRGAWDPETIDLIFNAFNIYVGVSVAEHVQFTFTILMLLSFSTAIIKYKRLHRCVGYFGVATAIVLAYGNLEVFGAPGAFLFNRAGSKMIALWLLLTGISLLSKKGNVLPVKQADLV